MAGAAVAGFPADAAAESLQQRVNLKAGGADLAAGGAESSIKTAEAWAPVVERRNPRSATANIQIPKTPKPQDK